MRVTPVMVSSKMAAFNSRTPAVDKYKYYIRIRELLENNAPKSFVVSEGSPFSITIALQTLSPELLNSIYSIICEQNE